MELHSIIFPMLIASIKWKPVNRKVFARVECILIHNLNELAYSIPLPTNTSLEIAHNSSRCFSAYQCCPLPAQHQSSVERTFALQKICGLLAWHTSRGVIKSLRCPPPCAILFRLPQLARPTR